MTYNEMIALTWRQSEIIGRIYRTIGACVAGTLHIHCHKERPIQPA